MARHWDDEQKARIRLRMAAGERLRDIAVAENVNRNTLYKERRALMGEALGMLKAASSVNVKAAKAEPTRQETRDGAFWKVRAAALAKELGTAEHLLAELAGVVNAPSRPAEWLMPHPAPGSRRAVVGCLISDVHAGEVINAEEMDGLGEFDLEICRRRLRRYFAAAIDVGQRWTSDCSVAGCLVLLGGDLVSGSIHEELNETNALTSQEQVLFVVEELTVGLRSLAEAYGAVHVASVPGNHGRTKVKESAKLYSRLSYDTLVAKILVDRLADDKRISFQVTASFDAMIPVLGHSVFLTHGHKMGTGGGQGFAGPMLPIVRGAKKVEAQQARANRRPDLICHGHYHTSGNAGNVLSNGSVPGYSEYAKGLRASLELPQQWLFVLHEKWGLRDRAEIKLEDPAPHPKPVVSITAAMREA